MTRRFLLGALVVLLGIGAASCAGEDQEGSPAHRMIEWVGGTGLGGDIGTLRADNARVPKDVPNGTGAVHAACGALEDDAEQANGELPTPDPKVTDLLAQAYGLEGTEGTLCYNAGATNMTLLVKAERDGIKAEALYDEAIARIQAIDGRAPSTTTTTDNNPTSIFG
jgi:hypothetical protein